MQRQLKVLESEIVSVRMPNMERGAQLVADLPALWTHAGVTNRKREAMITEVFREVQLRGSQLVAIEPKAQYRPFFAYLVTETVRNLANYSACIIGDIISGTHSEGATR